MRGVFIRDGTEPGGSGGLEFDLSDILAALGERVEKSRWMCPHLHYISRNEQDIPVLERIARGERVMGFDLTHGVDQLLQVIDGTLEAFDENDHRWAVIRAVDSSWWEVWSDDDSIIDAVRSRFRVVHDVPQNAG